MSNLNFKITGKSLSNTKIETSARKFKIVVDEPQALGGTDSAPNPVEYILAGYAGCLNVVINLIASERKVKINNLNININGDINPDRFLGISKKNRAGFQSFIVEIEIDSDSSEQEIKQLIEEVKDRCPVNDNLANITPVNYKVFKPVFLN
jgi:uncharacterized OsmC-like protein